MRLSFQHLGSYGALGNQLWQIAGTYGEAKSKNIDPLFPKWFYQRFFSVPDRFFNQQLLKDSLVNGSARDMGQVYLQDVDHWWNYRDKVFNMFEPSEEVQQYIDSNYASYGLSTRTAIHVRRANNLALPDHHPVPNLEYFEHALSELVDNSNSPIVFSDDLEWCKKQSIFNGAIFGLGNPSVSDVMQLTAAKAMPVDSAALDLLTMAQCKDMIISNSTFSGWAAMISSYKNYYQNRVVSPKDWYGSALKHIPYNAMFKHHPNWIELKVTEDGQHSVWTQ